MTTLHILLLLLNTNTTTTGTTITIAIATAAASALPRHVPLTRSPTRIPILNVVLQSGKKHRLVKLFVGEKKIEKNNEKRKK